MERPTCVACIAYAPRSPEQGECRIERPRVSFNNPSGNWPAVEPDEWCCEHSNWPRYLAALDEGRHARETMP